MPMDNVVKNLKKRLPPEAFDFFVIFSRFEYALKRNGYLKSKAENVKAKPDWSAFVNTLGEEFFNEVGRSESVEYLLNNPPKTQIVKSGDIDWKDENKIGTSQDLFCAIRRVRNNLFHGGKYHSGSVDDPARNEKLLSASIYVLEQALEKSQSVSSSFYEML